MVEEHLRTALLKERQIEAAILKEQEIEGHRTYVAAKSPQTAEAARRHQ